MKFEVVSAFSLVTTPNREEIDNTKQGGKFAV